MPRITQPAAAEPEPAAARVLPFLNSNFGLWLLSAIFITGAGSAFTKWQDRIHQRHAAETAAAAKAAAETVYVDRLDSEIAHRISTTLISLYGITDKAHQTPSAGGRLAKGHSRQEVAAILRNFVEGRGEQISSLYPEFANSSTLQLVTDLRRFQTGDRLETLNQIVSDLSGMPVLMEVNHADYSDPVSVAGVLETKIADYQPWRANNFYFLDCSADGPFC